MLDRLFNFLESNRFDPFTDWIGLFVTHNSMYAPMLLLMIEESGVPLPIPGDVYVAYTGYLVEKGAMPFWLGFVLLMSSVLIGSSILYYLSVHFGQVIILRFGKYIHLDEKKLILVEKYFKKYGFWVIVFGRHIPGFRIPITFFSGISQVPYRTFISSTFISVIFWILFYLSVGSKLGPRILRFFHGHNEYYLILAIPFIIFIGSILYHKLYKVKKVAKKEIK